MPHPDFIGHPPGGRTAVVFGIDDSMKIIDVTLVTKIDIGPPDAVGTVRSGESE